MKPYIQNFHKKNLTFFVNSAVKDAQRVNKSNSKQKKEIHRISNYSKKSKPTNKISKVSEYWRLHSSQKFFYPQRKVEPEGARNTTIQRGSLKKHFVHWWQWDCQIATFSMQASLQTKLSAGLETQTIMKLLGVTKSSKKSCKIKFWIISKSKNQFGKHIKKTLFMQK